MKIRSKKVLALIFALFLTVSAPMTSLAAPKLTISSGGEPIFIHQNDGPSALEELMKGLGNWVNIKNFFSYSFKYYNNKGKVSSIEAGTGYFKKYSGYIYKVSKNSNIYEKDRNNNKKVAKKGYIKSGNYVIIHTDKKYTIDGKTYYYVQVVKTWKDNLGKPILFTASPNYEFGYVRCCNVTKLSGNQVIIGQAHWGSTFNKNSNYYMNQIYNLACKNGLLGVTKNTFFPS